MQTQRLRSLLCQPKKERLQEDRDIFAEGETEEQDEDAMDALRLKFSALQAQNNIPKKNIYLYIEIYIYPYIKFTQIYCISYHTKHKFTKSVSKSTVVGK